MIKISFVVVIAFVLTGCSPFVPVRDLSKIPSTQMAAAMRVRVYTINQSADYPPISLVLGEVSAYSCKLMMTDPPASKGDALKRLRVEAQKVGADAVIDVTFDKHGADAFGTNCWQSVHASGEAVKIKTSLSN